MLLYIIKQQMRHNHHMRQLALLFFEGRATDEEEL